MTNSIIVNDNLKFVRITLTEDHLYDPTFIEFREYDEDGDIILGCDCEEALCLADVFIPLPEVCKAFGGTWMENCGATFTGNDCEYEAGQTVWALVNR